jgi:hypothetical protein
MVQGPSSVGEFGEEVTPPGPVDNQRDLLVVELLLQATKPTLLYRLISRDIARR